MLLSHLDDLNPSINFKTFSKFPDAYNFIDDFFSASSL
jgi:hypothetical protein